MNASDLIDLSPEERKQKIIGEIVDYDKIEDELYKAAELSRVINGFINEYIDISIERDAEQKQGGVLNNTQVLKDAIDREFAIFLPTIKYSLKSEYQKIQTTAAKNIYELSGAYKLAFANNATRTLSTKLGLFLEKVASISPYAVNPESEFAIKIKGVDLVSRNKQTGVIEYLQVKTQKNTLTGSQTKRVVSELSLHDNSVVCASFPLSNWTFNHCTIRRAAGADFWERIGMPFQVVSDKVSELIMKLEDEYVSMLEEETTPLPTARRLF